MNSIETALNRLEACLAAHDKQQTAAFAASDARVSAKAALIEAQEKFDQLTAEWKDSEAALELVRYGLNAARADLEAELRARMNA